MPSGITGSVYEGDLSLKKYLTNVARSLSDFIHMRDEASNAELKPRTSRDAEPFNYYEDKLARHRKHLNEFLATPKENLRERYNREMQSRRESIDAAIERNNLLRERYDTMIAKIEAMEFPDEISYGKDFALRYLEESKSFDVLDDPTKYHSSPDEPFDDWYDNTVKSLMNSIEYSIKRIREEKEKEENFTDRSLVWVEFINSLED